MKTVIILFTAISIWENCSWFVSCKRLQWSFRLSVISWREHWCYSFVISWWKQLPFSSLLKPDVRTGAWFVSCRIFQWSFWLSVISSGEHRFLLLWAADENSDHFFLFYQKIGELGLDLWAAEDSVDPSDICDRQTEGLFLFDLWATHDRTVLLLSLIATGDCAHWRNKWSPNSVSCRRVNHFIYENPNPPVIFHQHMNRVVCRRENWFFWYAKSTWEICDHIGISTWSRRNNCPTNLFEDQADRSS